MIPFNIDKFRAGAKVITRDGREVKQLTEFDCDERYPLSGVVKRELVSWTIEGLEWGKLSEDVSDNDLFHPEPEMWVNVYDNPVGRIRERGFVFTTKEEALISSNSNISDYIGTFKLVRDEK
jgi:hypothetical protein